MPVEVLHFAAPSSTPDGDEHLDLVINEAGEVILDKGPAFV